MKLSVEIINLIFLLAPGFISVMIFNEIAVRKTKTPFENILEAMVFFFLIYITCTGSEEWRPLAKVKADDLSLSLNPVTGWYIAKLSGAILIYPIVFTIILHYNTHMLLLRKLRFTDQTARASTWLDVFTDEKREVTIDLKDGSTLYGSPRYYSSDYAEGFLYIEHPSWVIAKTENPEVENQESEVNSPEDDNAEHETEEDTPYVDCTTTHGVLINREDIHLIHFMKTPTEIETTNKERHDNQNE